MIASIVKLMPSVSRGRSVVLAGALVVAPLLTGCTQYETPEQTGMRLYQEKNYTEAAGAFRNAVRRDPQDYKAQYHLAVALDADGRSQEAIESYRTALGVMKYSVEGQRDTDFRQKILDGLAIAVARHDTHDTNLNLFERQAKESQKAEDFYVLAKIYRYRGDADMALDNYQHAVLLDNKNFPLLKEYGLYQKQTGQTQRAAATLSQAYRVNDKDQQVIDALRELDVVPGPSLKEQNELASPLLPKGPIPPPDWQKIKGAVGLGGKKDQPQQTTPVDVQPVQPVPSQSTPAASLQAPRD